MPRGSRPCHHRLRPVLGCRRRRGPHRRALAACAPLARPSRIARGGDRSACSRRRTLARYAGGDGTWKSATQAARAGVRTRRRGIALWSARAVRSRSRRPCGGPSTSRVTRSWRAMRCRPSARPRSIASRSSQDSRTKLSERQRRRLHAVRIELLARLLDAAILRADAAAIAARADALIRLDPLSEQSIAGAMAALETLGETDRARRLRERLTSAMRDEIDAEPSVFDFDAGITADHVRRVLLPLVERGDVLAGSRRGTALRRDREAPAGASIGLPFGNRARGDLQTGVACLAALSRSFFDRGHGVGALR